MEENNVAAFSGFGLGLRAQHYQSIVESQPAVDWFEALTEDYLIPGGQPLYYLQQIAERYPIVLHGVSMSLGSTDALDFHYLVAVKQLASRINAVYVSDHLCWTGVQGHNMHELLPLPLNEESLRHFSQRVQQVQDFLQQPLLIENPATYLRYQNDSMTEAEFLTALCAESGCLLLLDLNNVYVSAYNHDYEAKQYIEQLPTQCIQQIHLAGHQHCGDHLLDSHDCDLSAELLQLYGHTLNTHGVRPTMIERDDNIPPFEQLLQQLSVVKQLAQSYSNSGVAA